ncbi:hypothetical protein SOJ65_02480 [Pseudomonas aeruginosa]|uniref:hypothetical protein n=1 Tax=Pseudomonas aeruginosa TaxID=287 RepID=UPI002A69D2E8|nr:hypothetical protein [Pseudomonas aeruginosa]MDY1049923.1 hypothetical protein [Pseudomonas aeruginosa]
MNENWGWTLLVKYVPLTLPFAFIAVAIAYMNYRRKSGLLFRCNFTISVRRESSYPHISEVLLENLKDRSVTIFSIYLRIGKYIYIELKNFEDSPLLIKAYEASKLEIDFPYAYRIDGEAIDISNEILDLKTEKRIILSTSEGKYVIPKGISKWTPAKERLKNPAVIEVSGNPLSYGGVPIGDRSIYLVSIYKSGEKIESFQVDAMTSRIKGVSIGKEDLVSEKSLQEKLNYNYEPDYHFLVNEIPRLKETKKKISEISTFHAFSLKLGRIFYRGKSPNTIVDSEGK